MLACQVFIPLVIGRIERAIRYVVDSFKWAFSAAEKPGKDQIETTARFVLLMVFVAGVVSFTFSIARSHLFALLYGRPVPVLSGTEGLIASLSSLVAIIATVIYLLVKFR